MDASMEKFRKFAQDNNLSFDALARAAGMDLSTLYRKMRKGGKSFTVGELLGMVEGEVMLKEDAVRIFLS